MSKNPFRPYRHKYVERTLLIIAADLALLIAVILAMQNVMAWKGVSVLIIIVGLFAALPLMILTMLVAGLAFYFYNMERLYDKDRDLALAKFASEYEWIKRLRQFLAPIV